MSRLPSDPYRGMLVSGSIVVNPGGPIMINSGSIFPYQLGSGAVSSGFIASGQIGAYPIASGSIYSFMTPRCTSCGIETPLGGTIHVTGASGLSVYYCRRCAGFQWDDNFRGFKRREDWIREELKVNDEMPLEILADMCMENGRNADAQYLLRLAMENK